MDKLRIALVVPPMLPVPPVMYAGTERVVANIVEELVARGYEVTLFGPGDSTADCELVPTVEQSLWSTGYRGTVDGYIQLTVAKVWEQHHRFDVIHWHAEAGGFNFARHCPTPVLTTLHGRLDVAGLAELMAEFTDIPLVAISESQRRFFPDNNWLATIHHGLDATRVPWREEHGDYLAFTGRIAPEKGLADAIEVARQTGLLLKVAAKVYDPPEKELFTELVEPAISEGIVDFQGELEPGARDRMLAGALATLMLGAWPEPFGLVSIESMATGTPVVARRAGALTEIIEHGTDGFLVDDVEEAVLAVKKVAELDRRAIRRRTEQRFSRSRMAAEYEALYRQLVAARPPALAERARRTAIAAMADRDATALPARGTEEVVELRAGGAAARRPAGRRS